jgi:hypothetical protein
MLLCTYVVFACVCVCMHVCSSIPIKNRQLLWRIQAEKRQLLRANKTDTHTPAWQRQKEKKLTRNSPPDITPPLPASSTPLSRWAAISPTQQFELSVGVLISGTRSGNPPPPRGAAHTVVKPDSLSSPFMLASNLQLHRPARRPYNSWEL